jgi:hypothetical protein
MRDRQHHSSGIAYIIGGKSVKPKCLSVVLLLSLACIPNLRNEAIVVAQASVSRDSTDLLIRCDDIGMCHSVNAALKELVKTGVPFSASVMFACPWYREGVEILEEAPHVSVGIHLTLNSEWKSYRWGPVAGWSAVPSLTDSCGNFFPSRKTFFDNDPEIEEVEIELRAQIERALATGLHIDYLDYHMGTAVQTDELRGLVERLADEYQLGISRYFGEIDLNGVYRAPVSHKIDTLLALLEGLEVGSRRLMVFHIGLDTPEMGALEDLNPAGIQDVDRHRHAELQALLSPQFLTAIRDNQLRLTTYRQLIRDEGMEAMERPPRGDYR